MATGLYGLYTGISHYSQAIAIAVIGAVLFLLGALG